MDETLKATVAKLGHHSEWTRQPYKEEGPKDKDNFIYSDLSLNITYLSIIILRLTLRKIQFEDSSFIFILVHNAGHITPNLSNAAARSVALSFT